jgi:transcriptional regulator with XRE-family HTH domain
MTGTDWAGRGELTSLLRACRARLARPAVPGSRGGLRQEDVANLAGLSLRRYAALERGEFRPPASTVDQVATALRMSEPERSALHVLATGQDPPRPVTGPAPEPPREPSQALRDMVTNMDLYPAALTDETWTLKHLNSAMNTWAGGGTAPPRPATAIWCGTCSPRPPRGPCPRGMPSAGRPSRCCATSTPARHPATGLNGRDRPNAGSWQPAAGKGDLSFGDARRSFGRPGSTGNRKAPRHPGTPPIATPWTRRGSPVSAG